MPAKKKFSAIDFTGLSRCIKAKPVRDTPSFFQMLTDGHMDIRTHGHTDTRTDTPSYRDATAHLKSVYTMLQNYRWLICSCWKQCDYGTWCYTARQRWQIGGKRCNAKGSIRGEAEHCYWNARVCVTECSKNPQLPTPAFSVHRGQRIKM